MPTALLELRVYAAVDRGVFLILGLDMSTLQLGAVRIAVTNPAYPHIQYSTITPRMLVYTDRSSLSACTDSVGTTVEYSLL